MIPVGEALLSTSLGYYISTPDIELASEIVCWFALAAAIQLSRRRGSNGAISSDIRQIASSAVASTRAWLFALGIAAACWYRAEERTVVLYPVLTPLLVFGIRPTPPIVTDSRIVWAPLTTKWNSVLIATFSCFALVTSNEPSLSALAVCVVVVALLYGGYLAASRSAALAADVDPESADDKQPTGDTAVGFNSGDEALLLPLALCILPLLVIIACVRSSVLQRPSGTLVRAVVVGAVKALSWFSTFRAARSSSWCVAGTIGTFAITSTRNTLFAGQLSYLYAASHIVAALFSLGQTIRLSPKGANPRSNLWTLAVVPLLFLLANIYSIDTILQLREMYPIEALARAAETRFDALVARQSRTYVAAESEYRRRYGIEPPPGFEGWYNFSRAYESPIIDDFDMIHEAVAPFLRMTGPKVREVMAKANGIDGVDLWKCELKGKIKEVNCNHPFRNDGYIKDAFERWLKGPTAELPDLEFFANYLDEPRVMLHGAGSAKDDEVEVSNIGRRPIFDKITGSCPKSPKLTRALPGLAGFEGFPHGLPFVTDTRVDKDLCRHPEYRDMHGLVISPTSFILIEGAVPVLTPGTLSTMGDVLFPSPSYMGDGFTYHDSDDVEWDKKKDNLYWAGSTTGGYGHNDDWKKFHRQRFVALARGLDHGKKHWYLRERDGIFRRFASPILRKDLFDVVFSSAIQCDDDICKAQEKYFDMHGRADQNAPFGSKLVFDLDGNGISGRFNKLLASRSAVLKQTLLREWHDERLVPWVHYFPVSQGLGELPEMVAWLMGTEEGRRRAKMVADRGREWAAKTMREEDRVIYVYRLLLELARMQDPGREAM
ncbi:hypothetical protein ACCO45_006739 [Purpureocillium lilacinum]|uniref:Uncharacterized protein n=1 Tax=Purpureocillium lilacinum TaxID=33203 RepID=A0ACC4DRQ3_PURLI